MGKDHTKRDQVCQAELQHGCWKNFAGDQLVEAIDQEDKNKE